MSSFNHSCAFILQHPSRQPQGPPTDQTTVNFSRWTLPAQNPSPPTSASASTAASNAATSLSWRSLATTGGAGKQGHTKPKSTVSVPNVSATSENRFASLPVENTSTCFRPNAMVVQERTGRRQRGKRSRKPLAPGHKEYLGDRYSKYHQAQVVNLDNTDNCATYITGVPLSINPKKFFAAIDCGAVATIDVKDANEKYSLKAADVVFTKPEAAARFVDKINSGPGVYIDGQRLSARYNKFGQYATPPGQTRVVFVEGPEEMMGVKEWLDYFDQYSIYVLEDIREIYHKNGRVMLEFYFVRIVGQAQTIKQAIEEDDDFRGIINVGYSRDPCEN